MSNADTILKFLAETNTCCDDCIAAATRIEPRQQVNQICRRLEPQRIARRQDRCARCGRTKIVNVTHLSAPESRPTASSQTRGPAAPREPNARARLVCDKLQVNDADLLARVLQAATATLSDPKAWHPLEVHREYYFRTPDSRLPIDPGWYVICDATRTPLYVGKAENLDARLNSPNGSLDQFAHSGRSQDPTRNFIKALCTTGYISALRVGVVREADLLRSVGLEGPLANLDRNNVEKLLGIFRHAVVSGGV